MMATYKNENNFINPTKEKVLFLTLFIIHMHTVGSWPQLATPWLEGMVPWLRSPTLCLETISSSYQPTCPTGTRHPSSSLKSTLKYDETVIILPKYLFNLYFFDQGLRASPTATLLSLALNTTCHHIWITTPTYKNELRGARTLRQQGGKKLSLSEFFL